MARRALLIGSETYGLSGCIADVALMRTTLEEQGFDEIDIRSGSDATRAGIVDGLDRITSSIRSDDAIVVYYSGHGARVTRPDFEERKAAGSSVHFQFLVPDDIDESDVGDFRGLLSEELTAYQRRMTDGFAAASATANVTMILDCCHSGYMARSITAVRKSIELPKSFRMRGVREHADALVDTVGAAMVTNPDAVRLVACQIDESAYEFPSSRGGRHGALTDALASVLSELECAKVSWGVVGELVRRRVRTLVPEQRPDVEGPADRRVFSADASVRTDALPVSLVGGEPLIEAASVLGIALGDRFAIVSPDDEREIGTAEVVGQRDGAAVLDVTPEAALAALSATAVAVPTRVSVPAVRIWVDDAIGRADDLHSRIVDGVRLDIASTPGDAVVRIAHEPGGLVLCDEIGQRWRIDSFADDERGHARIVDEINAIAVGHRLLDLRSGTAANALPGDVALEFGTVENGQRERRPLLGEQLTVDAAVFLTVRNESSEPRAVWVFDVGVSGRSALLTNAAPSGVMLGPSGSEDDTFELWGPGGERLFWPVDVPPAGHDQSRWESFVVLVADRRNDLSSLASGRGRTRSVATSALDAILDEARIGTREVAPPRTGEQPLRYRLERVQFRLA